MNDADSSLQKLIVIGGPTAVGKTTVGVALAKALDGEVISADSVQLFAGFRIGAATPSMEEREGVPHHLLEVMPPDAKVSAADFAKLADEAIADVVGRGKVPILVGGSGLYVRALIYGLVDAPPRDDALRQEYETFADTHGDQALWEKLRDMDPETAAGLHANDRIRVIRALEVRELTGQSFRDAQRAHGFQAPRYDVAGIGLTARRAYIHERINLRAQIMFREGLLSEVQQLLADGAPRDAQPFTAIGYRETLAWIDALSELPADAETQPDISTLEAQVATNTRNFARRQLVWFRKEPSFRWFDAEKLDKELPRIRDGARAFLAGKGWTAGNPSEREVSDTVQPSRVKA